MLIDFSRETRVVCESNFGWETTVAGSHGDTYRVAYERDHSPTAPVQMHWVCECKGFTFRKTCRHIAPAMQQWCGWGNEAFCGDHTDPEGPVCPRCGGPLTVIEIAV